MHLGEVQNAQNHKSEHLYKDSTSTAIRAGPLPIVDYKKELRPFNSGAWWYHGSRSEACCHSVLETNAHLSICRHHQWWGLHVGSLLHSLLSHKLPPLCVTWVWLYRLIREVSPNKPGFVGRHKCVWVTPFRDAPLFMTIPTFKINWREYPLGMGQRMPECFWKTKAKPTGSSCPVFIWFEKAFWIVYE